MKLHFIITSFGIPCNIFEKGFKLNRICVIIETLGIMQNNHGGKDEISLG